MSGIRTVVTRALPRGTFARNVAVLAGGTALGHAIVLASLPLVTRLYAPEHFGVLAVYMAAISVLAVLSTLRYEAAIPLPKNDRIAAAVLLLSLGLTLTAGAVLALALWLLPDGVLGKLGLGTLKPYVWFLPLGVMAAGVCQSLSQWIIRQRAFSSVAKAKLAQSSGLISTQLGVAAVSAGPLGLLMADVAGRAACGAALAVTAIKRWPVRARPSSFRRVARAAWRYRRFPLLSCGSGLLNCSSLQVPIILFTLAFGGVAAGLLVLSLRVFQAPMALIAQSSAQVFFASAAEDHRRGRLADRTWSVYAKLVTIAAGPMLLVALAAPMLFGWLFGEVWRPAGDYVRWLVPWLLLVFVASPLSRLTFVLEKQHIDLWFQASLLVGRVLAILLAARYQSALFAVGLLGTFSATTWLIYMLWLIRISGNSPWRSIKFIGYELVRAGVLIAPAALSTCVGGGILPLTGILISSILIGFHLHGRLR